MLFGGRKLDSLETVVQIAREFDRKKTRIVRWVKGLSDNFFEIIRTFFAGPEKAPAEMNRATFISLQDIAKHISIIKEKLQDKFLVVDLKGLSGLQLGCFHGVGNLKAQFWIFF